MATTDPERLRLPSNPASQPGEDDDAAPWKLLLVDDEAAVHQVTAMALGSFRWDGRPMQLLSAYRAAEARELASEHPDIAIALVDVVMETDTAGLDCVAWLRENCARSLRVLIRTGQAGTAPPAQVATHYEIDGYLDKAVLTVDDLRAHLIIHLRAYQRAVEAPA